MAPILGPDGKPLKSRGWYDTEALADDGGVVYVGIERVNQVVRFDIAKDGLRARGTPDRGAARHEDCCRTTRASNAWRWRPRAARSPAR